MSDYKLHCNSNEYLFNISEKVKNPNRTLLEYIMYKYDTDDSFKTDVDDTNYISIERVRK